MKKLIPLLTLAFALSAGDLLAQDKKDDKKADPPKTEEKAKADDADTKKAAASAAVTGGLEITGYEDNVQLKDILNETRIYSQKYSNCTYYWLCPKNIV